MRCVEDKKLFVWFLLFHIKINLALDSTKIFKKPIKQCNNVITIWKLYIIIMTTYFRDYNEIAQFWFVNFSITKWFLSLKSIDTNFVICMCLWIHRDSIACIIVKMHLYTLQLVNKSLRELFFGIILSSCCCERFIWIGKISTTVPNLKI